MTNGGMRLGKNGLENNNLRKREKEREREREQSNKWPKSSTNRYV